MEKGSKNKKKNIKMMSIEKLKREVMITQDQEDMTNDESNHMDKIEIEEGNQGHLDNNSNNEKGHDM